MITWRPTRYQGGQQGIEGGAFSRVWTGLNVGAPVVLAALKDLTTIFVPYLVTRKATGASDLSSSVVAHRPTVKAANPTEDDEPTMYDEYLS